jgi:indolepyruvate ferredoxin oxidoreductase beta subunit
LFCKSAIRIPKSAIEIGQVNDMVKTDERVQNILIVGVGGQGVILASEILSEVAMKSGCDVKKSEVHGMAQRGGVVSSHVRYGQRVYSPLIPQGEADVLLAFEVAEAVRWTGFLSPKGRVIASCQRLIPPIVSTGLAEYPDDAEEILRQSTTDPILFDALEMAEKLGNARLVNTILLGVCSTMLGLSEGVWKRTVAERVPPAFRDLNMTAFAEGRALGA